MTEKLQEMLKAIRSIEDKVKRKEFLDDNFVDIVFALTDIYENDKNECIVFLERIANEFRGNGKTSVYRDLKNSVKVQIEKRRKERFNNEDFSREPELEINEKGKLLATQANIKEVIACSNNLPLVYDDFSDKVFYEIYGDKQLPWENNNEKGAIKVVYPSRHAEKGVETIYYINANLPYQRSMLKIYLNKYFKEEMNWRALSDALTGATTTNRINIYRDFFENGLPEWDGKDRMDFLYHHAGATNKQWASTIGHLIFLGMVWRAFEPGYDYRGTVIFEGPEESGKSRLCRLLAFNPLAYTQFQFNKYTEGYEISRQIVGNAIVELAELGNINAKDREMVKAWLTKTEDENRRMHQDEVERHKRVGIIIVTTNEIGSYLKISNSNSDSVTNTRFDCIHLAAKKINIDAIAEELPQLYAQAKYLYDMGVHARLTEAEQALRDAENSGREIKPDFFYRLIPELKLHQLQFTDKFDDGATMDEIVGWFKGNDDGWFNAQYIHRYKKEIAFVLRKYFHMDNESKRVPGQAKTQRKWRYCNSVPFNDFLASLEE